MADSLLTVIQEFCDRRALDRPGSVMTSADDTIRQLRSLSNEVVADVTSRNSAWPKLAKQANWISLAAQTQGNVSDLAPYGFKRVIPDTVYDQTARLAGNGPTSAQDWEVGLIFSQPYGQQSWRIFAGTFGFLVAPPAGHVMVFEYESDYSILAADGTTWKKRFTADTDAFQLNSDLLFLGLNAKWRREKGLSYAQEMQDYEYLLTQEIGNSPNKGEVNMAGARSKIGPGFIVPAGNWKLP